MAQIIPIPTAWTEEGTAGVPAWDRERYARYLEATAFYDGDQWIARRRRGETRLTVNYARALVRKVASYVFPAPVTFSVPSAEFPVPSRSRQAAQDTDNASHNALVTGYSALGTPDAAARRAELALADVVATNDLAHLDVELCVEASVLGDAAVKVTWDPTSRQVVVASVDPATLSTVWRPDNPRLVDEVTHRYLLTGAAIPRVLGPGIDTAGLERGRTYRVIERWTPARWTVEVAGQVVRDDPNPYGWIPYVVAANNPRPHEFWGESDLVDLYDVCRELNARLSVLARVLELSGAPIAVLENVDGSEGIAVGPGAKWELPEGAKAYLLDLLGGGGVHLHIDYVNLLYRALHDLSETPRTAFGDSGRTISGAALEVEVQPLVQKVHRKRRMWEGVFRERNARILDLLERFGGLDLGGLRRTTTIWPNVLPSDTDSAVRNAVQLVAHGIHSRHTAIATLGGDDPDGELARVIDELSAFSPQLSASRSQPIPFARPSTSTGTES